MTEAARELGACDDIYVELDTIDNRLVFEQPGVVGTHLSVFQIYAVLDYAARESMRGRPEARLSPPSGRPRKGHPLSGAERMRLWRDARC